MVGKNDYKTGNVLDYFYHQKYYKLNCIKCSTQADTNTPQQTNFKGRLEKDAEVTIAEKQ